MAKLLLHLPNDATLAAIVDAALVVMADFATRSTPYESYTAADIAAAVSTDQKGETAFYFASLVAKSIGAVATLDYVERMA